MKIIFLDDDPTRVELAKRLVPWPIIRVDAMSRVYGDQMPERGGDKERLMSTLDPSSKWVASLDIDNAIGRVNGDTYYTFGNAIMELFSTGKLYPSRIVIHSHNVYAVDLLKDMLTGVVWIKKGVYVAPCPPIKVARFPAQATDPEAEAWRLSVSL